MLAALTVLSALITILAEPWAFGVPWAPFVCKPLTTLLIIVYAWPRGADEPRVRPWILAGLALSLLGDVALLWPAQGFIGGLVAFLLAHLSYILAFSRRMRFAALPLPFVVYAAVTLAILWLLWPGVPQALRLPVVAYVICLATMAAQAAVAWRSAPLAAIGGALFVCSDALLATNKFMLTLPASGLWILASYWAAQWCSASSLRGRDISLQVFTKPAT